MAEASRIDVRLQPRGGRDAVLGWREDRLLVRVSAPPVDGRANVALCRLLAKTLGVPRGAVTVVLGTTNRDKTVEVAGRTPEEVAALLPPRGS